MLKYAILSICLILTGCAINGDCIVSAPTVGYPSYYPYYNYGYYGYSYYTYPYYGYGWGPYGYYRACYW